MSPGRRCVHVTSTVMLPDNVLRITAACSINPHYTNGVNTLPGCVRWEDLTSSIYLFIFYFFALSEALNGTQALVPTCMYPVGYHSSSLNRQHVTVPITRWELKK